MRKNPFVTALRPLRDFSHAERGAVFAAGAFTAAMQTLLVREVFAVVSGNELIIGIMLAVWLAATALGSVLGGRIPASRLNHLLIGLLLFCFIGMTGIRASRLMLMPGESLAPHFLLPQ